MIGRGPHRAALLGGQQLAGPLLRGQRLAQRLGVAARLLADLAQFLAYPGQLVPQLVRLHPGHRPVVLGPGGPLLCLPDLVRHLSAVRLRPDRLAGRPDQVAPAVRASQIGDRRDLHRIRGGGCGPLRDGRTQITRIGDHPAADPLPEQRIGGELSGDGRPAETSAAIGRKAGNSPQRRRYLLARQAR
jgi:hypothetical protein